jgi:yecA family protein
MKSQPLTDTELDHLSAVLERFGDKRSMNLEQLDGFLAALICGPELVPPSKYLPKIWGDQTVFEDASSAQEFLSLIMRHWNAIADTLNSGEVYLPLLLEDERPMGTIGQTASYVEWSSEETIGLFC